MDKTTMVVLATLLLCAHSSSPLQRAVGAQQTSHQSAFAPDPREHQYETPGDKTAAAMSTAVRTASMDDRTAGTPPRSGDTTLRTVNRVRGSTPVDSFEGGGARGTQEKVMSLLEEEDQGIRSGGVVEAVEGREAEEDKGIEEGEAAGFVVVARDSKSEGEPEDSLDNDNSSTNGISNNMMVIVFCALAFVANGGFLVYVFWVM